MAVEDNDIYQNIFWDIVCRALSPRFDGVASEHETLCELCCGASSLLRHIVGYFPSANAAPLNFHPKYIGVDSQPITISEVIARWKTQDESKRYSRRIVESHRRPSDYGSTISEANSIDGYDIAFLQANVLSSDFIPSFECNGLSLSDMTFCMIPSTANTEKSNRTNEKIDDWDYAKAAIDVTKPRGRIVIAAPIRMLKSANRSAVAKDIRKSCHVQTVTILREELTPNGNIKLALIIIEKTNPSNSATKIFDATQIIERIFEPNRKQEQQAIRDTELDLANAWLHNDTEIPFINAPADYSLYPENLFESSSLQIGDLFLVRRGKLKKTLADEYPGNVEAQYIAAADLADGEFVSDADKQPLRCEHDPLTMPATIMVSEEAGKFALPNGPAILLSRNGFPFKTTCVLRCEGKMMIPADSIYIIEANKSREEELLLTFAYLASDAGQSQLKSLTSGSKISQLSPNAIRSIAIPNASPKRRKEIIDELRDNRNKAIKAYNAVETIESEFRNLFKADEESIDDSSGISIDRSSLFVKLFENKTGLNLIKANLHAANAHQVASNTSEDVSGDGLSGFRVKGTNIFIMVTWPLTNKTKSSDPLLFKADAIDCINSSNGQSDFFFVYYCQSASLWRTVQINKTFLMRYKENGNFATITQPVRKSDKEEKYVAISATDDCVKPIDYLFERAHSQSNKPMDNRSISEKATGTEEKFEALYGNPSFQIINKYLSKDLGLKTKQYKYYIGYKKKGEMKMTVTVTPKEDSFTIKLSPRDRTVEDKHTLGEFNNEGHLIIEAANPDKTNDILDTLSQLAD